MGALYQRTADLLKIERQPDPAMYKHERRDLHDIDKILASDELLAEILDRPQFRAAAARMGQPKKLREIKGMGAVWDYRAFTSPNGGAINPLVYVEHIPVIRQMSGRADLDALWRVLVSQGLMVHNGSDGEGNVALYVGEHRLAYHARGANSLSIGTEHMHYSTSDPWSNKQLNAAAYLSFRAYEYGGIPASRGLLGYSGPGAVSVRRRGHVTHEEVSRYAGYNDRSDPGDRFENRMDEIMERARYFNLHGRF